MPVLQRFIAVSQLLCRDLFSATVTPVLWTIPNRGTPLTQPWLAIALAALIVGFVIADNGESARSVGIELCPQLAKGDVGICVARLQSVVNTKCHQHIAVDGVFGDQTVAAVRSCQTAIGVGSDGIVGPTTKAALRDYTAY